MQAYIDSPCQRGQQLVPIITELQVHSEEVELGLPAAQLSLTGTGPWPLNAIVWTQLLGSWAGVCRHWPECTGPPVPASPPHSLSLYLPVHECTTPLSSRLPLSETCTMPACVCV